MPGEPVVLVSGRGGHIRSFVGALARFPAEPQWAVVGGFAVYVRITDIHRVTNDLDTVSRNQPSLVQILVAEPDADRLTANKLQFNQGGAAVVVDVMADTADEPLPTEPGERAFAHARRMALATSESTELGVPMWHGLMEALQPDVVIVSIRNDYVSRIKFDVLSDEESLHEFDFTKKGIRRHETYRVKARWHLIGDQPSLFAFGKAGRTPFQSIDNDKKHSAGEAILRRHLEGL